MDTCDIVALNIHACSNEIKDKLTVQGLCYFDKVKLGLDIPEFRLSYYGPYSNEVSQSFESLWV